jgi:hypothetical protein
MSINNMDVVNEGEITNEGKTVFAKTWKITEVSKSRLAVLS